jgi:phosphate uptake regulator
LTLQRYLAILILNRGIVMSELSKRSTVYFEAEVHQALRVKAASAHQSVSKLVNDAVRVLLREDQEDLNSFSQREHEPNMSYEELLEDLKTHGKI